METERSNLFFSPQSIHQALMLALFGAKGETEAELRAALKVPNVPKSELIQKYKMDNYFRVRTLNNTITSVTALPVSSHFHASLFSQLPVAEFFQLLWENVVSTPYSKIWQCQCSRRGATLRRRYHILEMNYEFSRNNASV